METKFRLCDPEIWGGIECTINRVGELYRDQLLETGHYFRNEDIDVFSALGFCKMRYPVLWEKHAPEENKQIDWDQTSARLTELRSKDIIPIAGLLHHGSGPIYTNLLDEAFPEKLAAYAGQVASQFPWLEYYTPVNEPLTTARFSGLYGFWYPHHSDERSFFMMLFNQVKGIILSMKAIRIINPAAKLVQTEDLCKIYSSSALTAQAAFENDRRWLTGDLLCGKFTPAHPLWKHCVLLGISETTLAFFLENTCPPYIMGCNYYVTSERYLDERLENYPPHLHGGNGRQHYADIDAARANKRCGLAFLLKEAWERYQLPMAVTECHLNCGREDQMRWLQETWDACIQLNQAGIPVVAVTAWSLLGSCDWDSLLLHENGHYESGVFDTSNGSPRPTILTTMIKAYANGDFFNHPLLATKGWWHAAPISLNQNVHEFPPLLIIHSEDTSPANWDYICQERRIPCLIKSINLVMETGIEYLTPHVNRQPWGIIMLASASFCDDTPFYEDIAIYCNENNISFMVYSCIPISAKQQPFCEFFPFLILQSDRGDNMKFVQEALNLFIDQEKGCWILSQNSAPKIQVNAASMLY